MEKNRKEEKIANAPQYAMMEAKKAFLLTTGYSFDGYQIKEYLNIVHGEICLGTGFLSEVSLGLNDMFGTASDKFSEKIAEAKSVAERQLVDNAYIRGANAIIGVDYDISIIGNNAIMVSTNGTAVKIEKIKSGGREVQE